MRSAYFIRWLALGLCLLLNLPRAATAELVRAKVSAKSGSIENAQIRIEYDLTKGTYDATDKTRGLLALRDARTQINDNSSDQPGYHRTATSRATDHGGRTLAIRCAAINRPGLLLELTIYPDQPYLVLAAGVENLNTNDIIVQKILPLTGAIIFPGDPNRTQLRTLDGFGGSGPTRVIASASRSSPNNLLLTYLANNQRRSLVMGGLTYHEFCKFATVDSNTGELARTNYLSAQFGKQAALAAYLDCGDESRSGSDTGPQLRLTHGQSQVWNAAGVDPRFTSLATNPHQIIFSADKLDARKAYALGWSWWDFDQQGRVQSIEAMSDYGQRHVLADKQILPARDNANPDANAPQERAALIPPEAYATGKMQIVVTKDQGSNAVISELWLWEGRELIAPADWLAGKPATTAVPPDESTGTMTAELKAADPVGKRVGAGRTYLGDEKFYVAFVTADPFTSLEQYGLAVRAAQQARPNPYDFPTTCGWYLGLFQRPEAGNDPARSHYLAATTTGLVDETQQAAESGFLNYSRMAVRVVPDKYETTPPLGTTQGGWWDDEHWGKYGHYAAPYETTEKYCQGVRARGGLPFTYFQCTMEDPTFRLTHTNLLLDHNLARGLDYSNPDTQTYMRQVYAPLRTNGIAGIMFDYADRFWNNLGAGGFADSFATAAGLYRNLFALAKAGLGTNSWIDERVLGEPYSDLTAGVVDSQRIWGDNNWITPAMISRAGLRWYKNRVLFSFDLDAKNILNGWRQPGFHGTDQDGLRMLLTMSYVAASRMLLSTSYRDLLPETLHDLERIFPYHTTPQSARPVDMLVCQGEPQVYDFAINPQWHQVTFFNNHDSPEPSELGINLSGEVAAGSLGLDATKEFYVYDFWNNHYAGRFKGDGRLTQTLRPGEARMLAIHQVESHPQFLSTSRHLMQGFVDLIKRPVWNAAKNELSGTSSVVGGDAYQLVLANNCFKPVSVAASIGTAKVKPLTGQDDLSIVTLSSSTNADIHWSVRYEK